MPGPTVTMDAIVEHRSITKTIASKCIVIVIVVVIVIIVVVVAFNRRYNHVCDQRKY